MGVGNPMALLGKLQRGQSVEIMEDAQRITIEPSDVIGDSKPGRVIALLGGEFFSSYYFLMNPTQPHHYADSLPALATASYLGTRPHHVYHDHLQVDSVRPTMQ